MGLLQLLFWRAMSCMAANFARSLRATAPMERWDQSWHVLVLLLKLQEEFWRETHHTWSVRQRCYQHGVRCGLAYGLL